VEIRYESLAEENKKRRKRVASSKAVAAETGEVVRRRPRSEEKKALLKLAVKAKVRFRRSATGELVIRLNP
jgi:hypothetical protein